MKRVIIFLGLLISSTIIFSFGPGMKGGGHSSNYSIPEGMTITELNLMDGVFQGVADGFRPELVVEIEVKDNKITSVEVISHNEVGRQYFSVPIKYIPDFIVKEQQTEVDSVTGATATSKAIMSAVENALTYAIIK